MDFLSVADGVIIGAIFAAMEVIKALDREHKLKRLYPLFVLGLGVVAAYAKTQPYVAQQFVYNCMVYVAIPSYVFKFGKTTILGK